MRVALQMSRAGCVSPCRRSVLRPPPVRRTLARPRGKLLDRADSRPCTIWRKCKSPATRMTSRLSRYHRPARMARPGPRRGASRGRAGRAGSRAAGLLCLGLGLAAWRVSSADGPARPPAARGGFLVVNGGLLFLGSALVWAAAVAQACRPAASAPGSRAARRGADRVAAAGLLLSAGPSGGDPAVALGLAARRDPARRSASGHRPARGARRCGSPGASLRPGAIGRRPRPRWSTAAMLRLRPRRPRSALTCRVVLLGVIVAAWSGLPRFIREAVGRRRWLPRSVSLVPAYWLLATIAGPEGVWHRRASPRPLSPAAESLVAPALLLVGWSIAGLWPLHRQVPGALSARWRAAAGPDRPFLSCPEGWSTGGRSPCPFSWSGIWHAAARGRWPLLAVGAGLLGRSASVAPRGAPARWLSRRGARARAAGMLRRSPGATRRPHALGADPRQPGAAAGARGQDCEAKWSTPRSARPGWRCSSPEVAGGHGVPAHAGAAMLRRVDSSQRAGSIFGRLSELSHSEFAASTSGAGHGVLPSPPPVRLQRPRAAHRRADDADPSRQASRDLRQQSQRGAGAASRPAEEVHRGAARRTSTACPRRSAPRCATTAAATPITPRSGR